MSDYDDAVAILDSQEYYSDKDFIRFSKSDDVRLRVMVARNLDAPVEALRNIAEGIADEDPTVVDALLKNPNIPVEVMEWAAKSDREKNRLHIVLNFATPSELLRQLAVDHSDMVRKIALKHLSTPPDVFNAAAFSSATPDEELEAVAGNRNAPGEALDHLASSDSFMVRIAVGMNDSTSDETLFRIIPDREVARYVARRQVMSAQLAEALLAMDIYDVNYSLSCNIATPASVLTQLAECDHDSIRISVAQNRSTPSETLAKMWRDGDNDASIFSGFLVRNPSLNDRDVFLSAALDSSFHIRENVASHPKAPVEALRILCADSMENVRYEANLNLMVVVLGEEPVSPEW